MFYLSTTENVNEVARLQSLQYFYFLSDFWIFWLSFSNSMVFEEWNLHIWDWLISSFVIWGATDWSRLTHFWTSNFYIDQCCITTIKMLILVRFRFVFKLAEIQSWTFLCHQQLLHTPTVLIIWTWSLLWPFSIARSSRWRCSRNHQQHTDSSTRSTTHSTSAACLR